MASTLPVFNDTQGFTGTLQYVDLSATTTPGTAEAVGWFKVDDVDALRALPTLSTNKFAVVDDIGGFGAGLYRWDGDSSEDDDGAQVLEPTDGLGGRWVRLL
jgi:hypothetical protein